MIYLLGKKIEGPPILDNITTFYSFCRPEKVDKQKLHFRDKNLWNFSELHYCNGKYLSYGVIKK